MKNQTENYIVLKPIAERFSRVTSEISDSEIKNIITSVMREEIKNSIDFTFIGQIVDEYIDNNEEFIISLTKDTIINKFSNK